MNSRWRVGFWLPTGASANTQDDVNKALIRRLHMIFGGGILGLIILIVIVMFVVRRL
jgi:uncharacterized membrane protein